MKIKLTGSPSQKVKSGCNKRLIFSSISDLYIHVSMHIHTPILTKYITTHIHTYAHRETEKQRQTETESESGGLGQHILLCGKGMFILILEATLGRNGQCSYSLFFFIDIY